MDGTGTADVERKMHKTVSPEDCRNTICIVHGRTIMRLNTIESVMHETLKIVITGKQDNNTTTDARWRWLRCFRFLQSMSRFNDKHQI